MKTLAALALILLANIKNIQVPSDITSQDIENFVNNALKQLAVLAVLAGAIASFGAVRRRQQNELFSNIWIVSLYATFCLGGLALIAGLIKLGLSFFSS